MNQRQKLIALTIWWCEGSKTRRDHRWKNALIKAIEVTNTDYRVIKIFVDFLKDELGVPAKRFKAQLQIHVGDNQQELEQYWSKEIGIPTDQFNKTIIRKVGNKPGKSMGTFKVRLYDKGIYEVLEGMLQNELQRLYRGVAQLV